MRNNTPLERVKLFWSAPEESLFCQKTISLVVGLSEKWFERKRYRGGGIPYIKLGRRCLYQKADVVSWIRQHQKLTSTSDSNFQENSKGSSNGK